MKNILWTGISCIALLFVSCGKPSVATGGDQVIDVGAAMSHVATLTASDYFRKAQYVALETTDSCLIGNEPVVLIIKDRILITTAQKQALLFDKTTGRFIRSIGHVGEDPKGYSDARCHVDEKEGLFYFRGWHNDLVCYDSDGDYRGTIRMPVSTGGNSLLISDYLNKDTLVNYYTSLTGSDTSKVQFFNASGEVLNVVSNYRQGPAFGISDVGNISVFDGETAVKKFGRVGMEGVVVIRFKDTEMNSVWFGGSSYFWHQGEKTCFKEPFNDTIFVLTGTTLTPDRILNLGNYHWDYAERFRKNKDGNIYPTQFIEGEDFLFFRFITGLYSDDNRKLYDAVYNKATGEVKIGWTNDGLTDDLTGFLAFRPTTVSASGEYAGLIPIEDIHAWFDEHDTNGISAEVLKLKQLKEDDNPVVVFYK